MARAAPALQVASRRRDALQSRAAADAEAMDASAYAFAHGVRHTRATLRALAARRRARCSGAGSPARRSPPPGCSRAVLADRLARQRLRQQIITLQPPFAVGDLGDVARRARAATCSCSRCTRWPASPASSPAARCRCRPSTAHGVSRWVHEHGGRIAIAFVVARDDLLAERPGLPARAHARRRRRTSCASRPALLLLGVLPHAIPELIALFLPLAAWIIASRRGEWEQLLAATVRDRRDRRAGARGRGASSRSTSRRTCSPRSRTSTRRSCATPKAGPSPSTERATSTLGALHRGVVARDPLDISA